MKRLDIKPQNILKPICFTAVFALIALFIVFAPLIFGGHSESAFPVEQYTFEQTVVEPDGTTAKVFASGDSDFRYLHDGDGYVLITDDEGYLRYAKNDGGRAVASNLRWNASSLEKAYANVMTAAELDRNNNPQFLTLHETAEAPPAVLANGEADEIFNVVIFIKLADSSLTAADIPAEITDIFSNDDGVYDSLRSYFSAQTAGEKKITNILAYDDGAIFVYNSPKRKKYFTTTFTDAQRCERESELITAAAEAFNSAEKTAFSPDALDSDGDGYADAVTFVILDSPDATYGSIFWPHKWHAAAIGAAAEVAGVPIGVYSLNFTKSEFVTFVHEAGHVLGAPDLYASANNSMPLVAQWDVMSLTARKGSPSNMLVYTRKKYLGMKAGRVETVYSGQRAVLVNAADAEGDDPIAVRIPTSVEGVFVYAEYRAEAALDRYDGNQQSSGLLVYRVNENIDGLGNIDAKNLRDYANIEVYVYRKGGAETLDAVYAAALGSSDKTDFTALGEGTDTALTINANVVLGAAFTDIRENGDGTVEFTVTGDELNVPDDYYGDKISLKGGEFVSGDTVSGLELYGVKATLEFKNFNPKYLSSAEISLLDETGAVTHKATASHRDLAGLSDSTFTVAFDAYAAEPTGRFKGLRETDAEPISVRLEITDADGDRIVLGDAVEIDRKGLNWRNVLAAAAANRLLGAEISEWTYFAREGESFRIDLGAFLPKCNGQVSAKYEYSQTALEMTNADGVSATFKVKAAAKNTETVKVVLNDGVSETTLDFAVVTDGRTAAATTVKQGSYVPHILGYGWDRTETVARFGGEEVALKDLRPLAFNAWAGTGARRTYYEYDGGLYYYDFTVSDRPLFIEPKGSLSILEGETLPEDFEFSAYYASGTVTSVGLKELVIGEFDGGSIGVRKVSAEFTDGESGTTVSTEFSVRVSRVDGAKITGTETEISGEKYPTVELASGGILNFGETTLDYYLDDGDERIPVSARVFGESDTDWFEAEFDGGTPTANGVYSATVCVKRRRYGRVTVAAVLENVKFRVLKSIERASIVELGGSETVDGNLVLYLEDYDNWQLFWRVEYLDGTSENVKTVIDKEEIRLGVPFDYAPPYLNHQTEGLGVIVINTAVEIACDTATNYWGERPELNPYAVMADGTVKELSADEWRIKEGYAFDEKGAIGVAQRLVLVISETSGLVKKGGAVEAEISLTPVDGMKSFTALEYKKIYEYGDAAFSARYIKITNYSGKTSVVSPAPNELTVEGFDSTVVKGTNYSAEQTVVLRYEGMTSETAITIINPVAVAGVAELVFDKDCGAFIKDAAANRPFRINVRYKNGASEELVYETGAVEDYRGTEIGKYAVKFSIEKEGEIIYSLSANVLNCATNVRQAQIFDRSSGNAPQRITIRFGEAVDISRYGVRYYTDSGAAKYVYLDGVSAYTATKNYSTKRENGGLTTVTLKTPVLRDGGGAALSFTIELNVLPRVNGRIIAKTSDAADFEIKYDGKIIVLKDKTSVASLMNSLKSEYLELSYAGGSADEWAGGYTENGGRRTFETVEIRNAEGTTVDTYKVVLLYDANGDGQATEADVDVFAKRLVENSVEIYDHEAAGGGLNIKVFANLVKILGGKTE